jgi:hypothetical protein
VAVTKTATLRRRSKIVSAKFPSDEAVYAQGTRRLEHEDGDGVGQEGRGIDAEAGLVFYGEINDAAA